MWGALYKMHPGFCTGGTGQLGNVQQLETNYGGLELPKARHLRTLKAEDAGLRELGTSSM
jgi:hypothetical protein